MVPASARSGRRVPRPRASRSARLDVGAEPRTGRSPCISCSIRLSDVARRVRPALSPVALRPLPSPRSVGGRLSFDSLRAYESGTVYSRGPIHSTAESMRMRLVRFSHRDFIATSPRLHAGLPRCVCLLRARTRCIRAVSPLETAPQKLKLRTCAPTVLVANARPARSRSADRSTLRPAAGRWQGGSFAAAPPARPSVDVLVLTLLEQPVGGARHIIRVRLHNVCQCALPVGTVNADEIERTFAP